MVGAQAVGYVQHVDTSALEDCAKEAGSQVFVLALPGVFADPSRPVARVLGPQTDQMKDAVAEAFTVGAERTFDQDPRFGLCVLSEIASRALSPAVNDPGTVIDVIGRAVRLLVQWARHDAKDPDAKIACPHVWVPALEIGDMFDDAFAPIARDGAGLLEIQVRLQKAVVALMATDRSAFGDAARRHSATALKRAETALTLEEERQAVRTVAAK